MPRPSSSSLDGLHLRPRRTCDQAGKRNRSARGGRRRGKTRRWGGDEIGEGGRPRALRHPEYFDPSQEPGDDRGAYAGLVWQTRYSDVEVPDGPWRYEGFGMDRKYSDSQAEDMAADARFMARFDEWVAEFARFVEAKGKVRPNK